MHRSLTLMEFFSIKILNEVWFEIGKFLLPNILEEKNDAVKKNVDNLGAVSIWRLGYKMTSPEVNKLGSNSRFPLLKAPGPWFFNRLTSQKRRWNNRFPVFESPIHWVDSKNNKLVKTNQLFTLKYLMMMGDSGIPFTQLAFRDEQ